MKACMKGMFIVLTLCLSSLSFSCDMDNVGGKTVGWVGDTGGKVVNGTAKLYGDVMYATFKTVDGLMVYPCDDCKK